MRPRIPCNTFSSSHSVFNVASRYLFVHREELIHRSISKELRVPETKVSTQRENTSMSNSSVNNYSSCECRSDYNEVFFMQDLKRSMESRIDQRATSFHDEDHAWQIGSRIYQHLTMQWL
jgi:hypothetical protein